MQKDRKYL
jgi:hypothetical protein